MTKVYRECRRTGTGHEMVRREGGLPGERVCVGCDHYEVVADPPEAELRAAVLEDEQHIRNVTDVDFGAAERVHDWRNHVPDDIRRLWPWLREEGSVGLAASWHEGAVLMGLIFYEAGDYMVRHGLARDGRGRLYEGILAVDTTPSPVALDRVLNFFPISQGEILVDHHLLRECLRECEEQGRVLLPDGSYPSDEREVICYFLCAQAARWRENPALFRRRLVGKQYFDAPTIPMNVVNGGLFGVGKINRR